MRWLIYGANGYTGELIAERAKAMGLSPILAGRQDGKVRPIAERLGLETRVFPLDDAQAVDHGLEGVGLVLHCAGPFSATARPMIDGCMRARAHYLDITGEIAVYEANFRRSVELERAGIVVMSGVGFDVVPTDCLAAALARALPGATHLELAFGGFSRTSRGTAKTVVQGLRHGGAVRRDGKIVPVPPAHETRTIAFADKPRLCMAIPWGDVSTAFHTTGIPNITVFMAARAGTIRGAKVLRYLGPLLARPLVQGFLEGQIERRITGPTAEQRRTGRVQLWGRASNAGGRSVEGTAEVPEGYTLTVESALCIAGRLLSAPGSVPPGARTPAGAFGAELLTWIPGCQLHVPR